MIGILGGTFDPVHFGHLRIALEAYEKYRLKEVRFIPCRIPVHKKSTHTSTTHRLKMLELATALHPKFVIDTREIERHSPSYMITTLKTLKEDFPHTRLGLIMGSDALENFVHWHEWPEILRLAKLLVTPRFSQASLPISSTQIRQLIKKRKNPQFLLPESVLTYIQRHKLYRE